MTTHEQIKAMNLETITETEFATLLAWEPSAAHASACNGSWSQREGACSCGLMHARAIIAVKRPDLIGEEV